LPRRIMGLDRLLAAPRPSPVDRTRLADPGSVARRRIVGGDELGEGTKWCGARERVEILMHEYNALRSEIVTRTSVGFQRLAVGAAVAAWLGSYPFTFRVGLGLLLTAAAFGASVWVNRRDHGKLAARLRQIEARVDAETGEWHLLQWERRWGSASTGWWGRAKPLPEPARPSAISESADDRS
jgi:hypothetical protein